MSLYQKQREQIKKSILDTSVTIFKEKGYENATVDEITKTVGVAKGTFYNFYSSKGEVLLAWAVKRFQNIDMEQVMSRNNTLEENLNRLIGIMVEAIGEEKELFRYFLEEVLKVHGHNRYTEQFDFPGIYRQIINNSKDSERVTCSLADVKINVLNNSLFMGMINWFDAGNPLEGLEQQLKSTVRVCLYGLLDDVEKDWRR